MTEMTNDIEEAAGPLSQMGLTRYEAKVLVALLKLGRSTVREIYPVSGVPRSAVYGVLERLRAKGLVQAASTRPISYISVSAEEVMEILEEDFEKKKEGATDVLSNIHTEPKKNEEEGAVWLIKNEDKIIKAARKIILSGEQKIMLVASPKRIAKLKDELLNRINEGVKVSLMVLNETEIPKELGGRVDLLNIKSGERFRNMPNFTVIISDNYYVLFSIKHPMENGFWAESSALASFFSMTFQMDTGRE